MNEHVAECNNAIGISNLGRNGGIPLADTVDRFSDDFEIALDRLSEQAVGFVGVRRKPTRLLEDETGSVRTSLSCF